MKKKLLFALLFALAFTAVAQRGRVYKSLKEVRNPDSVYILQLNFKRLRQIPPKVFEMHNLRKLDLGRNFIDSIGYTKFDALNDYALLEASVRDDLNKRACRVNAVIDPVKLVLTNYPESKTEEMIAINNPENEADGTHTITFGRELWIERDDFMEVAEKKFQRLAPGKEVRLKNAYIIKCDEEHPCDKDSEGRVTTIYATYDPETRSGMPGADRKIKGKTLHWVNSVDAVKAEVRLYDRLFSVENPAADERDFRELLNPDSLRVLDNCFVEPYLKEKNIGDFLQFQRIGYFTLDLDSAPDHLVFNKTVGLKDTWKR